MTLLQCGVCVSFGCDDLVQNGIGEPSPASKIDVRPFLSRIIVDELENNAMRFLSSYRGACLGRSCRRRALSDAGNEDLWVPPVDKQQDVLEQEGKARLDRSSFWIKDAE